MLILSVLASLILFSCRNNKRNASMDTEGPVTNVLDTIPPPADEANGMDNRPGYHTTRLSTDLEKQVPIPDGNLDIAPPGMAFKPDNSSVDFSPNRYTYRYLVSESGQEIDPSPVQRERPPLFSSSCLGGGTEDVLSCSNAKLLAYLRQLPDISEEGRLLYAVVILGPSGKVEKVEQVQCAGNLPCAAYKGQARRVLLEMPAWEPAVFEGRKVSAQVAIPLRLELNK